MTPVRLFSFLVFAGAVSGCFANPAPSAPAPTPDVGEMRVLPAASGLIDLSVVPKFKLFEPVATGFLGEPTLISDANGSLYLSFPGCPSDRSRNCANGPVYRSDDVGASWTFLNPLENGSLAEDSPAANGDAMLAIDSAGTIYASNLGGGTPVWSSSDRGTTWTFRGNPVPRGTGSDRQWAWGGPAGVVVVDWMQTNPSRVAAIAISRDYGETFSKPFRNAETIGWIGTIAGTPDATKIFAAYTVSPAAQDDPTGYMLVLDPKTELEFFRSLDGGKTWEAKSTGHTFDKNPAHLQWPGTLMAPILGMTGSGTLVYAWSEENMEPTTRATGTAAVVKVMTSKDDGNTWTAPQILTGARTAIMPWFIPGAGDAYALAYYAASDVHALNDYEGTWDVEVTLADGAGKTVTAIVAPNIHQGGICTRGGVCGATLSDRSLLDFLGGTTLPDGRLAIAYASSPGPLGAPGSGTSALVAVQETGARIFAEPAPQTL